MASLSSWWRYHIRNLFFESVDQTSINKKMSLVAGSGVNISSSAHSHNPNDNDDKEIHFDIKSNLNIFNILEYGAIGDGITDCKTAFSAAINAMPKSKGNILFVPSGSFYSSDNINITRTIILKGSGGGYSSNPASILKFAAGKGIIVHSSASAAEAGTSGVGTIIEGLQLEGAFDNDKNSHGIKIYVQTTIKNCSILQFGGDGVHINASIAGDPWSNANGWRIIDCFFQSNKGNGLFVQGGDSNAGYCIGSHFLDNRAWGVYDNSFLGNGYIACSTDFNLSGGFAALGAVARNVLVGCYSEGSQPANKIKSPSIVVGGIYAAGFTIDSDGTRWVDGTMTTMAFKNAGTAVEGNMTIGHSGSTNAYYAFTNQDDTHSLYFKYGAASGYPGFYGFNLANIGGWDSLLISGQNKAKINAIPMAIDRNKLLFVDGFFLNNNKVNNSTTTPTAGTWNLGDIVYNTKPTPGGFIGWVCTTSGTAGTYTEGRLATTNGTTAITLNTGSSVFKIGDLLEISGVAYNRIQNITGSTNNILTMSFALNAANNLSISYSPPVFKTFGAISN